MPCHRVSVTKGAKNTALFAVQIHSPQTRSRYQPRQSRAFIFDSLLGSALGPCPLRSLTHTKVIPYAPSSVFKAVSDVSGYPAFVPFALSSHVISRDSLGYPTKARLRVGYAKFGLEENWDSAVRCDPHAGIVEAKSSDQNSGGLFEILNTKWVIKSFSGMGEDEAEDGKSIRPRQRQGLAGQAQTLVKLDVDVKFRNPVYDQMFSQVEGKVASTMIAAFEKRVQEIERSKRR